MNLTDTITALLAREGGYTNDPKDAGGETNWGITVTVARAFGYDGLMTLLPKETAIAIYKQRYWQDPRLDKVAEYSPRIAEELLDTGVNMGVGTGTLVYNSTTAALLASFFVASYNVNGTTKNRLVVQFINPTTGAAYTISGMGVGTIIDATFMGFVV
jgi:hypothetical protein